MSTINEEKILAAAEGNAAVTAVTAADAGDTAGPVTGANLRATTDGADDGEIERELSLMESDASTLQKEGLITESEAKEKREQVAHTRKMFRELSPTERAAIVRRRREIGRELMDRQLSGAAVVPAVVRLNHTRLKPLFEQWWPYLNRMSINLQRFGRSTFSTHELGTVTEWFEKQTGELEAYVNEQLEVSQGFRERNETEMKARGDIAFAPTVTKPSMDITVEAYSRFSMRLLGLRCAASLEHVSSPLMTYRFARKKSTTSWSI
ncbi:MULTISPECIES: ATPase [Paraburkholderia]|uniref:ATPase n=1 Tax=Paraburkholderia nemoris TaxID=2793076 RepID=A0ABN7NFT9_9BURK|nr:MULTISPECIES: ATPase [Paraburkholderia]CAE6789068.1 hypothetical protein R69619_04669 [Paraburkholderia nemoris]CAE6850257.1 hypothetical protein R75777_07506 [Paraburkholderia nemoris]CAE6863049.1 hypothetical protein R69776_08111 [Paraburkholderia nemoris]CAE6879066.1 hypothetical protein R69749_06918 [Paraburkholderia domus]